MRLDEFGSENTSLINRCIRLYDHTNYEFHSTVAFTFSIKKTLSSFLRKLSLCADITLATRQKGT